MSPVSKSPLQGPWKKGDGRGARGGVRSPERIFANSFRLDFPPSSRNNVSPKCLLMEQYFRCVSARSQPPASLAPAEEYTSADVIVDRISRICRSTALAVSYRKPLVGIPRAIRRRKPRAPKTKFVSSFIRERARVSRKYLRDEKTSAANYVKILFRRFFFCGADGEGEDASRRHRIDPRGST